MAYTPTADDFNDVAAPSGATGYTPTLADFNDVASPVQVQQPSMLSSVNTALNNSDLANLLFRGQASPQYAQSIQNQVGAASMGALAGASQIPQTIATYGDRALNSLTGSNLQAPQVNFSNDPAVLANPGTYAVGKLAGSIGSQIPLMEATGIPAAIGAIQSVPGRIAANAALGGVAAGATNPDATPVDYGLSAATGGLVGGAGEALQGVVGTIPAAKQAFNDALTRLGMQDIVPVPYKTGNTATQKAFENIVTNMPMSGGVQTVQDIGNAMDANTNNLMSSFGVDPNTSMADLKSQIQNNITSQYGNNLAQHRQNYQTLSDMADAAGQTVPLTNYTQKLQDIVNTQNDPLSVISEQKAPPEVLQFANDRLDALKGLGYDGENIESAPSLSFNQATTIDPNLNAKISENWNEPQTKKFFSGLQDALNSDIETSVTQSGNQPLIDQWNTSKQYFGNNVAPFFDSQKDLAQFIPNAKNPNPSADNIINALVKPGASGNATQLGQYLNLVPGMQNQLGYGYLNQAANLERNAPSDSLSTAITANGKLNSDVASTLFDPDKLETLRALTTVKNGLGTLPQVINNINTGQKANYSGVMKAAVGAPFYAGIHQLGMTPAGVLAGTGYTAATLGAGRGANAFLKSQLANNIANGTSVLSPQNVPYGALAGSDITNETLGQ